MVMPNVSDVNYVNLKSWCQEAGGGTITFGLISLLSWIQTLAAMLAKSCDLPACASAVASACPWPLVRACAIA